MNKYMVVITPKPYALGVVGEPDLNDEQIMEALGDRFYAISMKQIFDESMFSIEKRGKDE